MDGNAKLTETTLSRSLTALYSILSSALEKGKAIKATEKEGFLMDAAFCVAIFAGWIEFPESRLPPELHYILTPEAKKKYADSDPPPTVMLGGFEVPENIHDEFISLFWHNQPDFIQWASDPDHHNQPDSIQRLFDPDPLKGLRSVVTAQSTQHAVPASPDPELNRRTPAEVLIHGKNDLGISWEKLGDKATKHLQSMADEEAALQGVTGRLIVQLQVDSIYRLLRGNNIRPDNAKALAAAVGVDWKLLRWPVRKPKQKRNRKRKLQVNFK